MRTLQTPRKTIPLAMFVLLSAAVPATSLAGSLEKRVSSYSIHLGVVPAAMMKTSASTEAERSMHGGVPREVDKYHLTVAVIDIKSGQRVKDATVSARIEYCLDGMERRLERMVISETVTYGQYFSLPNGRNCRIDVSVRRPSEGNAVKASFDYTPSH